MQMKMSLPPRFSMKAAIYSHGWSVLAPFLIDTTGNGLSVALRFTPWPAFILSMRQYTGTLRIRVSPAPQIKVPEFKERLRAVIVSMLRLDDDLSALYHELQSHDRLRWVPKLGAGRILRAPSSFEDTVKMLCTTNCSWALTTLMIERLTRSLGTRVNGRYTFPTAPAMARQEERFYRNEIRAGYRSPYLRELAQRVAEKDLDLEGLRSRKAPKDELLDTLRSIKGIGPYAAENLLRFHGDYDTFAHDSWTRAQYARIYHHGRRVTDRTIERRYALFGKWKGLVYWLDMTRPWYEENFEFV